MAQMGDGFADHLRARRGTRSKKEVSEAAKVSRKSIGKAERGERLLRLSSLKKLCTYYDWDLAEAVDLMSEARRVRDQRTAKGA